MAEKREELTKCIGTAQGDGGAIFLTGTSENSGLSLAALGGGTRGVRFVDCNY